MKWWPSDCHAGDLIRVKVGAIWHYGVFVSEDEVIQFGLPPTDLVNLKPETVRVLATDIDRFAGGQFVEVAQLDRSELHRRRKPEETVAMARSRIGEGGYDLLHNNCEHFAYDCVLGERRCEEHEQARSWWRSKLKERAQREKEQDT